MKTMTELFWATVETIQKDAHPMEPLRNPTNIINSPLHPLRNATHPLNSPLNPLNNPMTPAVGKKRAAMLAQLLNEHVG